jgi:hypothetical protein
VRKAREKLRLRGAQGCPGRDTCSWNTQRGLRASIMIGGSGTTAWLHGAACHTGDWERPELADGEPAALAMELSKLTFAAAWRRGGSRPLGPSPPPPALDAGIDDERPTATPISTLL